MEKLNDYLKNDVLQRKKNWDDCISSANNQHFINEFTEGLVSLLRNIKEYQFGIKIAYTKSISKILENMHGIGNMDLDTADRFMREIYIPKAAQQNIDIWDKGSSYAFPTGDHKKFDKISKDFWEIMNFFDISKLTEHKCNIVFVDKPILKIDELDEDKWYRCVHGRNAQNVRYTMNSERGGLYNPGDGKRNKDEYENCLFQEI